MKRIWKITTIAFVLLLLDFGLTTYYLLNYGDIVSEGNVVFNNSQYGYLVFPLNIIYLVMIFIASKIYCRYKTVVIESMGTLNYIKRLYTSNHSLFIIVSLCFTFIVASFVSRFTAILDWVVFGIYKENFFNTQYAIIRSTMPMERYDVVTGIIAGLVAIPLWFHIEYLKSKKVLQQKNS